MGSKPALRRGEGQGYLGPPRLHGNPAIGLDREADEGAHGARDRAAHEAVAERSPVWSQSGSHSLFATTATPMKRARHEADGRSSDPM